MSGYTLITGGAGFIGSNYAARCLERGESVVIFDNFSRHGAELNIEWLSNRFNRKSFELIKADIRDAEAVKEAALVSSAPEQPKIRFAEEILKPAPKQDKSRKKREAVKITPRMV